MKQLTCEMCGSTDLMKQDGVFVCQSCGTKYSAEEAKKMMVEGTVEVKGTVAVDISAELSNLYQLARRALDLGDEKAAAEYYDKVLEKDSNSWEALCYSVFCQRDKKYSVFTEMLEKDTLPYFESILKVIKENVTEKASIISAVNKVTDFALKQIGSAAQERYEQGFF